MPIHLDRARRRDRRIPSLAHALYAVALGACMDSTSAPTSARPAESLQPEKIAGADQLSHTALSGGATTIFDATASAFGQPAPNLSAGELTRHNQGDAIFSATFSADRASPFPGLGPMFENTSCESCHVGDGRGRPPLPGEPFSTLCPAGDRTADPIPYRATERKSSSTRWRGTPP